jgi:hypothetical protein
MVPDLEAAKRFYGELFGWTFRESSASGVTYVEFAAQGDVQGGMMASPSNGDIPPHWMGYVAVADVDASAKAAAEAGGKVLVSPTDIPNVGRFAIILDPQGGAFAPFKSEVWDRPDTGMPAPNTFCWDRLNVADPAKVLDFYAKVVGWGHKEFGGSFVFTQGDKMEASLHPTEPGVPGHWLAYVVAEDLAGTRAKAAELGAKVLVELLDIPGVGQLSVIQDPQGAVLGLFGNAVM